MAKRRKLGGAGQEQPCSAPPPGDPGVVQSIDAALASIADLAIDQLRLQWRNHLGGIASTHLPRWLLMRIMAYRIQAAALGDLDKGTLRIMR